jgi:hypothetical protein
MSAPPSQPPSQDLSTTLPEPEGSTQLSSLSKQESGQESDPLLHATSSILCRLPLECWLQILDELPQADLLSVSLVSKELRVSAL